MSDTQFVDNTVNPFTTYYYRIYVMNEFGKLGGSNIVSLTTKNRNIVINGSFEKLDGSPVFPVRWTSLGVPGKFVPEYEIAKDSSKSIKLFLAINDWGVNSWGLYQQITSTDFEKGKTYNISFWCKTDSLEQYESMSCHFATSLVYGSSSLVHLYNFIEGPKAAKEWTQYNFTLTIPTTVPPNYYLIFDVIRAGTMGYTFKLPMKVWLDDIRIEKIQ